MTKRLKPIVDKIPEEYGKKLDLIVKILTTHLTKSNKEVLFNVIRSLPNEISLEFIRYLLLGDYKRDNNKKKKRTECNNIINKFTQLLAKEGVKLEYCPVTYKIWVNQVDLFRIPKQRFLRFIKI